MKFQTSLKTRLMLMAAFPAAMLVVITALGSHALTLISKKYEHVTAVNMPHIELLGTMRSEANEGLRQLLQMTMPTNDEKEVKRLLGKHKAAFERYDEAEIAYLKTELVGGEKEIYDDVATKWKAVLKFVDEVRPLANSVDPNNRLLFSQHYGGDFLKARLEFYTALDKAIKFQQEEAERWVKDAEATAAEQKKISMLVSIVAIICCMFFSYLFSNRLAKTLVRVAERLSNGAGEVNSAAQQIASSSEDLSSSTSELAAATQETSASVEELSAIVVKNTDFATNSSERAKISREVATKGQQAVNEMIDSINDINRSNEQIMSAIEESNRNISEINKVITDIGAKTKVINDIVFQTKLLSFNASVEAARAGEQGKGFAVVAEEVGNLAQMSGNAAKEISSMLEGSIRKVDGIVLETKQKVEALVSDGKEKLQKGRDVANRCGEILGEVVTNVSEVDDMIAKISNATREQSQGIREITLAITQMDQVTQQNAASSQTTATASSELENQVGVMGDMVQELETLVSGRCSGASVGSRTISNAATAASDAASNGGASAGSKRSPASPNGTVIPMDARVGKTVSDASPGARAGSAPGAGVAPRQAAGGALPSSAHPDFETE